MKRILPIFLLLFSTIGYAYTREMPLQAFGSVVVSGPVHLTLHNGMNRNLLTVNGSSQGLKKFKTHILQQRLYIDCDESVAVNLNARHLRQLVVAGNSTVQVNVVGENHWALMKKGHGNLILRGPIALSSFDYFDSGYVKINHLSELSNFNYNGSGDIVLEGVSHLAYLNFNGSGHLTIKWIDSCSLKVCARGCGLIELAGVAQLIQADVRGSVAFDARFVRTKVAAVRTYDCARADLFVWENMYTMAANHSNIYYYNKPPFFFREMMQSGSVLDMTRIPGAYLEF